jgi:hypothetical protein
VKLDDNEYRHVAALWDLALRRWPSTAQGSARTHEATANIDEERLTADIIELAAPHPAALSRSAHMSMGGEMHDRCAR